MINRDILERIENEKGVFCY